MFISINLKGVETIHPTEPVYNRLHNKWDSICKIQVPKDTLNLLGIYSKEVSSYEINSYSNNKAIIESSNKINF